MKHYRLICLFLLFVSSHTIIGYAKSYQGHITYNSYRGLVMAGYQGWHNTEGDGANRGWRHYEKSNNIFKPGFAHNDLWPDVSEYEKIYPTEFKFDDGSTANVYSAYDASTVNTHFRWMKEYGLDGVFMQRFVSEIRNPSGLHHFNKVLASAMEAANRYDRAISIMYDLSGMNKGEEGFVISDIKKLAEEYNLFNHAKNPSYLYHNGHPLIAVWGVGFNDNRKYGLPEANRIINELKSMGFSVLIGVPTHWRKMEIDTENNPGLHTLIRKCDVVMPWFVGRYNEETYVKYHSLIKKDMAWAKKNKVDYAPLCYAGFSWHNMHYPEQGTFFVNRNKGSFYQKQLDFVIENGASMIYIAMFDEIDEGTAIYKIARKVPTAVPGSEFVPLEEGLPSDFYLKMTGEAATKLKAKLFKH